MRVVTVFVKKKIPNSRQSGIKPHPFQTQTYRSSLFPISGHKTQTDKRSKTTPFGPEPRGWGVLPTMAFTGKLRPKAVPFSGFKSMKGWGFPVEDPGEGPGARPPPPPLFLDQNEARMAEKRFLGDRPPPSPPSYLKVWTRH